MIILLEATPMIINRLELKGLHGIYNYSVAFRENLTFIYGENGCGKTTILDIVSSIVTGRLYNLFRYKFDELTLSYRENKRERLRRLCTYFLYFSSWREKCCIAKTSYKQQV